jgi:hypothetical protein
MGNGVEPSVNITSARSRHGANRLLARFTIVSDTSMPR